MVAKNTEMSEIKKDTFDAKKETDVKKDTSDVKKEDLLSDEDSGSTAKSANETKTQQVARGPQPGRDTMFAFSLLSFFPFLISSLSAFYILLVV